MDKELLARLKKLANQFTESDKSGLHLRWEFGRELLALRVGKKLPNDKLAQIEKETGLQRREIQYCLKFAERYKAEKDCVTAITQYPSWTKLVHHGLYKPKAKGQPRKPNADRLAERLLDQLSELTEVFTELKDARAFGQRLIDIGKQAMEAASKKQAA